MIIKNLKLHIYSPNLKKYLCYVNENYIPFLISISFLKNLNNLDLSDQIQIQYKFYIGYLLVFLVKKLRVITDYHKSL